MNKTDGHILAKYWKIYGDYNADVSEYEFDRLPNLLVSLKIINKETASHMRYTSEKINIIGENYGYDAE